MPECFDLVVIGTGAAALSVVYPCAAAGWRVAVADSRPYGGTCANRGCDPKKVLVGVADVVDWARRMQGRGVAPADLRIDWQELMRFKRTFTDPVPAAREEALGQSGVERLHGVASFTGKDTLEVEGRRISARFFVIATGAAPAKLNVAGEELLLTSDDFLDLPRLPERLVFVGGGYIAFEFAHLALRAGSHVTILHRGKRPLEQFDPDMVDALVAYSRRIGIDVRVEAPVERIERDGNGLVAFASGGIRIEADAAVHAAGRLPNLDALRLNMAGVDHSVRGVAVNEYLQSPSNARVYAAGDAAASGPALTPIAGYHGGIVAENLLHGNHLKPDYRGYASAVFTLPPLAATGLTEDAAQRAGLEYEVHRGDSSQWYSSRRIAEECSGFKVLVERSSGRVLGAHLLGQGSEEMINVFALAIRNGLRASHIRETLFAYPTHGSNAQYML
jgi:glutathione reductase (NADPH)